MTKKYDSIIIGAGQAGPALAARLTSAGEKVAIIEHKFFGGTCVNTGCIPTKALIASARVAQLMRRGHEFGIRVDSNVMVDMKRVKARKDQIVEQSRDGLGSWLNEMNNLDVYKAHGKLCGQNSVIVNGKELTSDKIFLNVGARAKVPDIPGLSEVNYFTNTDMVNVDFLPEHLIIIGGSYIGLEFAQMYKRFGSLVTVVEMSDRLISREDEDVSTAVQEILENEGVNIELNAECIRFNKLDGRLTASLSCSKENREITGTHVLLAVGREANTHDLGLEKAGVEIDERAMIKVDEQLRTSVDGIWALGECNGKGAFTHTSYNDYEIVADQLFGDHTRIVSDRIPCYGLFIDPPLGRAGQTEQQVRDSGINALIGKMQMSRVGRAKEQGETQGFIKILVDAESRLILGASILGLTGDEVIHLIIDHMYAKKPYDVIKNAVHIHPTVSELIPTLLQDLKPLS